MAKHNRILIIEDDASHRRTLERHLTLSGYEVCAAATGEEGLSKLEDFAPDLVLTDIRMPGLSGFEVLEHIRGCCPDLDVILVTAYDDVQTAIDAMKGGAYDYLVKPLDLDELDATVARCLRDQAVNRRTSRDEDDEARTGQGVMVGQDKRMRDIYKLIGTVARSRAPVLVCGETGTGKELIARTIHENSRTTDEPFVAINCAAVPETLLESELFGHVRGAFTGATSDRKGRFELAGEGTLFLDEIGDTSLMFQAKLLRVLQEREFYPVGGERPRASRCRIIAATNADLAERTAEGSFREDLLFRLRVIEINVPPLRERKGDIPVLAHHVLRRACVDLGTAMPTIPDRVMEKLVDHPWPGNVRELENTVIRAALLARGGVLALEDLQLTPAETPTAESEDLDLAAVEQHHVRNVLDRTDGNKSQAARLLGISRPRLNRILDRNLMVEGSGAA
ncbi:MAG: sigma-54 dependent transcriptional regulator [Gemmatimonadota bacterium]|jgi:DNA-binding NtrC family response regulator